VDSIKAIARITVKQIDRLVGGPWLLFLRVGEIVSTMVLVYTNMFGNPHKFQKRLAKVRFQYCF
jgi:uncharacterized protein YqfA (UPF0365 family)